MTFSVLSPSLTSADLGAQRGGPVNATQLMATLSSAPFSADISAKGRNPTAMIPFLLAAIRSRGSGCSAGTGNRATAIDCWFQACLLKSVLGSSPPSAADHSEGMERSGYHMAGHTLSAFRSFS
jgi:hypothetical protein